MWHSSLKNFSFTHSRVDENHLVEKERMLMNIKSEDCWWFCLFYFWVTMKKSMFNNRLWINLWTIVVKLTRNDENECGLTYLEWEFSGVRSDLFPKNVYCVIDLKWKTVFLLTYQKFSYNDIQMELLIFWRLKFANFSIERWM